MHSTYNTYHIGSNGRVGLLIFEDRESLHHTQSPTSDPPHTIASKCFYSFFTLPDFLGLRASPYHFKTPKHSILNSPSFFL